MIYLELFLSFFQVGLFSIGGGYAALPIIEDIVVHSKMWLSSNEWLDLIAIAEMTPGPISLNSATFVGTKMAGLGGAIIATIGNVLPSFIIVLILAYLYNKYKNLTVMQRILSTLRPAVVGLIAAAAMNILIMTIRDIHPGAPTIGKDFLVFSTEIPFTFNIFSIVLFIGAFITIRKVKINPVFLMLGTGGIGLLLHGAYAWLQ